MVAASSRSSRSIRQRVIGAAIGVLLFAHAGFVLWSELREHSLHELVAELHAFPRIRLLLALAATVLGYLALVVYDVISLAALGHRLPFRSVAYAAFLGYAF